MALRLIQQRIPTIGNSIYRRFSRTSPWPSTGLVIFLGGTGCGRATSMAAWWIIAIASAKSTIITVEDPIEFSIDISGVWWISVKSARIPESYEVALKNTAASGAQRDFDRRGAGSGKPCRLRSISPKLAIFA